MKYNPYPYQSFAEQQIIDLEACGLFLEMGLGKTVSSLSAVKRLIKAGEVKKILVIAPKTVCINTWPFEIEKWDHLKGLKISLCVGSEKERNAGLRAKADIYIVNRDVVAWLVTKFGLQWPFDMIIIDELSSFKSPKSIRFKALRKVRPLSKRVVGLTGTPRPNGLLDLWSQLYLLDQGDRLGKSVTEYRRKYFIEGMKKGHVVYKYNLKKDPTRVLNEKGKVIEEGILGDDIYEKEIYDKIGDICVSMKASDYLDLPERIDRNITINFSSKLRQQYDDFERDMVLALEDVENISAANAAGLTNKLLQFANGAVYDADQNYHVVHDEKLDALEEIVESADGEPVLVFYSYKHDLDRIKTRLKRYKPQDIKGKESVENWNAGKIEVATAHPASAGHGLNLQAGGHIIVWFGLPWSLELYQQANARLHRQGQTDRVIIHHLMADGTVDEDVLAALQGKERGQEALMRAVKARIDKHLNR